MLTQPLTVLNSPWQTMTDQTLNEQVIYLPYVFFS